VQFVVPSWRMPVIYVYLAWCLVEIVRLLIARSAPPAWTALRRTFAEHLKMA
jgi:hypothetical protein